MTRLGVTRRLFAEQRLVGQRIRLALVYMAVLAVIWSLLAAFVYSMESGQAVRQADQELRLLARHLESPVRVAGQNGPRPVTTAPDGDNNYLLWPARAAHPSRVQHPVSAATLGTLYQALRAHQFASESFYSLTLSGESYRILQFVEPGGRRVQILEDTEDDASRLARLLTLLMWGALLGLVLSIAAGYLLGLWTLGPVMASRRREQQLLSDVSHELRTPLAVVATHTELLLRHAEDPIGAHLPWIEAVYSETQRMSRLVRDLLDLSRLEAGVPFLRREVVDVSAVVGEALAIYRPVLEEAGLSLSVAPLPAVTVDADPMRLRQLLLVVLDNARKYSGPGGLVTVEVHPHGSRVDIRLRDTGGGPDARPRDPSTTQPNPWASRGETAPAESSGLGLAIARGIAAAHGGTLRLERLPGMGALVTLTLPRLDPRRRGKEPLEAP